MSNYRIEQDQDCESPLDNDCEPKVTYHKGARTVLGNEAVTDEEFEALLKRDDIISLPVYAYVHSGVSLRAGSSFKGLLPQGHYEFDSGRSGIVYVTKKDALEWYCEAGAKVISKKRRAAIEKSLGSSVEEFGRWLNGECYYYVIEDDDGNVADSCGGFIGYEYAEQEAKAALAQHLKLVEKEARDEKEWNERDVVTNKGAS